MTATLENVLRCSPLDFVNPFSVWVPVVLGCALLLLAEVAALLLFTRRRRRTRRWWALLASAGAICLGELTGGLWIWRLSQSFIGCSVVGPPDIERRPAESAMTQGIAVACLVATLVLLQLGITRIWRERRQCQG